MKIFVAGGTGVLGRATLSVLVEAGHTVRATARGDAKAAVVRALGAEPVDADLFDPRSVRRAITGSDAVLRLTTKIPPLMKMAKRGAWTETNTLRTVGARVLVDAAIFEQTPIYIHESVTFVYADAGDRSIGEDAQADDGGTAILRAALDGEREAARFSQSGRQGIVLRFGAFYGPDAPSTLESVQLVRRRMFPLIGPGTHYFSSIYVADAARAVAAALGLPGGTYNVCDDRPVPFAEYLDALAGAVGAPPPLHLPAMLGGSLFGDVWRYFSRSLRVSNARMREQSGWTPAVTSVFEGWRLVAAALPRSSS
jgi:nucleoside-diphosphate-sugar epimerase